MEKSLPIEKKEIILKGSKCTLVTFRDEFVDDLALNANSYNLWKGVRDIFPHPYTRDDALRWLETAKSDSHRGTSLAICFDNDGVLTCVGGIGFMLEGVINSKHCMEIGYWLGERYWGNGIVTEAVKLITEYGFSERFAKNENKSIQIRRIEAVVYDFNKRSQGVLLKMDL